MSSKAKYKGPLAKNKNFVLSLEKQQKSQEIRFQKFVYNVLDFRQRPNSNNKLMRELLKFNNLVYIVLYSGRNQLGRVFYQYGYIV